MDIKLNENMPIYMQIMNQIRQQVSSGKLRLGERIPSVRELASRFGVNPNTMQRALSELEREKLLCTERTSGRFVTTDAVLVKDLRIQEANKAAAEFQRRMEALGFSKEEAVEFFLGESEGEMRVG